MKFIGIFILLITSSLSFASPEDGTEDGAGSCRGFDCSARSSQGSSLYNQCCSQAAHPNEDGSIGETTGGMNCTSMLAGMNCSSAPRNTYAYQMCCSPLTTGAMPHEVRGGEQPQLDCSAIENFRNPMCMANPFDGCHFNEDATEINCGTRTYVLQGGQNGEQRHFRTPLLDQIVPPDDRAPAEAAPDR